jgi:subtilisin family serine protease
VEPFSGTSFAAPIVSAMLAAELQRARAPATAPATPAASGAPAALAAAPPPADTRADPVQLRARLASLAADSGAPGRDEIYGFGIVKPADACR